MNDGTLVGSAVIGLAIVAVLANGASATNRQSSGTAAAASRPTASAGTASSGSAASRSTQRAAATPPARPAPECAGVRTLVSADGRSYQQYLVSRSGSRACSLVPGDTSGSVSVLQRALALCTRRTVEADGIYGPQTAGAMAAASRSRSYTPSSMNEMRWPWRSTATSVFTGRCSPAGARVS